MTSGEALAVFSVAMLTFSCINIVMALWNVHVGDLWLAEAGRHLRREPCQCERIERHHAINPYAWVWAKLKRRA